ncbi:MAG: glycosyltransferase family 39 protein [Anaerolineae bacterium]|nr:glycosyltransferase family 39 protein [Anaerolineae bacterium]
MSSIAQPDAGRPRAEAQPLAHSKVWRAGVTALVGVIALALRWPYLMLVPRLTDETAEIKWAWRIAQGEILPLTHVDPYYGIVHPYLLAGLFTALGPHTILPRALNAVAGALLAALVAWVAWGMAGRTEDQGPRTEDRNPNWSLVLRPSSALGGSSSTAASLVAGLLTAASFPLIVVNSHIAWSNGLTPLFVTGALAATWFAVMDRRGWWLVGAGFLWGLALQTHPSVVTLLPGVVAWVIWQPTGRGWLRTRWPWLAVGAFLLGYANLIVANLIGGGQSVDAALNPQNAYSLPGSVAEYLGRVGEMALQLARMLAGSYTIQTDGGLPLTVTPWVAVYGALAVAALVWAARRRDTALLPLLVGSAWLLLPLVSHSFTALHDTRYIAFLLPPVYLALGLAAGALWARWATAGRLALAVTTTMLIAVPLVSLAQFYRDSAAYGLTNAAILQVAEAAHVAAAEQGAIVLLDREMRPIKLGGGGDPVRAMEFLMTTEGTPNQTARPDTINWYLHNAEAPLFLVLADATATNLGASATLTPTGLRGDGFAAYTARPAKR